MLVWDDVEADEKIKIYDAGVDIKSAYGMRELMVDYRSGDVLLYIFSQFWTLETNLSLQIAPDQGHCFVG